MTCDFEDLTFSHLFQAQIKNPKSKIKNSLAQRFGCLENLLRPGTHPVVFRQIHPPHSPGRIQQEFGRPGNILPFDAGARMDQVVAANHLGFRIGKKCEPVAGFLRKVARGLWSIDANRNRTNSRLFELRQAILNAPKLGVA
jgi:hypothetical protein